MKQKIINLQQKLAQGLVGREQTVKTALLSAVAGENVLLIGPPGTGKSMVSRRISQAIAPKEGASPYFEYLLTKFSTPEELFGPLSISALKQDRFERKTEGYLPDVQVAFLDEIFKASSSILNSLLTILNERKYHNGTESLDIPLQALVAASNELPKGQAELAALYDRFLLRCFVDYLDQNDLSRLFTLPQAADIAPSEQLTAADLADIQAQAREVVFPENIQKVLRDIWQQHAETFKEHADEQLSDRRFVKVLNLLRVSAATNGRSEVDLSDVMLLKDCLWNNDENREKVMGLLTKMLQRYDQMIEISEQAAMPSETLAENTTQKRVTARGGVIKGYRGSGTEYDPILIENLDHLIGLQRENIGPKGYYFRQTADIDCTALGDSWISILFKGCYDGAGYAIKKQSNNCYSLFSKLQEGSEVCTLTLEGLGLCNDAVASVIHGCQSTVFLIGNTFTSSKMLDCHAGENLVNGMVSDQSHIVHSSAGRSIALGLQNSVVESCQSGSFLIGGDIQQQSVVRNCCVNMDGVKKHYFLDGYIAGSWNHMGLIGRILYDSKLENVYVQGKVFYYQLESYRNSDYARFSGIVAEAKPGTICGALVGLVEEKGGKLGGMTYIINNEVRDNEEVVDLVHERNAFLGSNHWGSDYTGAQKLPPALFSQYYCEHILGWDFDTVWDWNEQENRPVLKPYQQGMLGTSSHSEQTPKNKQSLLQQQVMANIWL